MPGSAIITAAGRQDRHHLFSVTKSVLSSLVGIALQEGLLASPDQPVLDFFPEIHPDPANPLRLLTLRHLLAMASGLLWPRKGWHEIMVERLRRSPDWVRFILDLPVRREDIGKFHYCSAASHLLSAVLTRAAGQSTCDYARQRLFAPLGIPDVQPGSDWETDPQGITLGGWGLHLSAREIARFGWLYVTRRAVERARPGPCGLGGAVHPARQPGQPGLRLPVVAAPRGRLPGLCRAGRGRAVPVLRPRTADGRGHPLALFQPLD